MGNICRSPTAHGVFRRLVQESGFGHAIEIDSAGTHAYHVGKPPDVLAMDLDNLAMLTGRCPAEHAHKVRLFMEFAPEWGSPEVPDPYYGGVTGFEQVFDMVEAAARGLMEDNLERL